VTSPLETSTVRPGSETSKRWITVVCDAGSRSAGVCGSIHRWVATYRLVGEPYTTWASAISASESAAHSPRSRSMVRMVSIPRPEKRTGRRMRSHAATGRT
jgi:hypothetical protein